MSDASVIPESLPEAVGLSSQALEQLEPLMAAYIDQHRAPGFVVMIAKNGKLIYQRATGFRDVETLQPMTLDTLFYMASMTKPITAVAILQLVEQGKISLDAPVSGYVPELAHMQVYQPAADGALSYRSPNTPMTIRDLLTFTAGLKYGKGGAQPGDVVGELYNEAGLVSDPLNEKGSRDLRQMVEKLSLLPLASNPGSRWEYSIAYDLLGYCVEVVSGERFDQYLRKHIFEPLHMKETRFFVPPDRQDSLATIYNAASSQSSDLVPSPVRNRLLSEPSFLSGGSGLVSTAGDYLSFAQMLANGGVLDGVRILNESTVLLMRTNQLATSILSQEPIAALSPSFRGYGFGYGVAVLMKPELTDFDGIVGEYFWPGAANTKFWIDPIHDVVGVILTQVFGNVLPVDKDVKRIIYHSLKEQKSAQFHPKSPFFGGKCE